MLEHQDLLSVVLEQQDLISVFCFWITGDALHSIDYHQLQIRNKQVYISFQKKFWFYIRAPQYFSTFRNVSSTRRYWSATKSFPSWKQQPAGRYMAATRAFFLPYCYLFYWYQFYCVIPLKLTSAASVICSYQCFTAVSLTSLKAVRTFQVFFLAKVQCYVSAKLRAVLPRTPASLNYCASMEEWASI